MEKILIQALLLSTDILELLQDLKAVPCPVLKLNIIPCIFHVFKYVQQGDNITKCGSGTGSSSIQFIHNLGILIRWNLMITLKLDA